MSDSDDKKGESPNVEANKEPFAPSEQPVSTLMPSERSANPDREIITEGQSSALSHLELSVGANDAEVERQITRMSRLSFLRGGVVIGAGILGWRWLNQQRMMGGIPWPFRVGLEINENIARDYYSTSRLAPTFSRSQVSTPKENGEVGLTDELDPGTWKLTVSGLADTSQSALDRKFTLLDASVVDKKGGGHKKPLVMAPEATSVDKGANGASDTQSDTSNADDTEPASSADAADSGLSLTLADIKKLRRVEMVTELKCIEGWSVVVQWAGARFADFVTQYAPNVKTSNLPPYVAIETPDGAYYVGLDLESAMHPQTLLCYEMNGKPLTPEHGAPLRLVIPVKYGIKNIKRIGTIRFTKERPKDYWAELGYDWYAGH